MKIISEADIKDDTLLLKERFINNITFLDSEQCEYVLNASKFNVDTIKKWFNTINIKYDDIYILNKSIRYTLNGIELPLSELSSGERYVLYLLACKENDDKIIAGDLFERLGQRLEDVVLEQFKDYYKLTVIVYNSLILRRLSRGN